MGAGPGEQQQRQSEDGLERLRELLLLPDRSKIEQLRLRVEELEHTGVDEISEALPEAVRRRVNRDNKLSEALTVPVEDALQRSVKRDPQPLIDAVAPVIGPAIRKAVSAAIRGMTRTLNQVLEDSLSPRGLAWRVEAWRTGRSFAEVALLHSLIYRVEQVFLIHRETGLLLAHVVAPEIQAQDADMVSAMLTAIRDFVHDSFAVGEEEGVEALQVGDLNVWVEHSPELVLAGVIRGNAPATVRELLEDALARIRADFREQVRQFDGESELFAGCEPLLESCLTSHHVPRRGRPYWAVGLVLLLVAAALVYVFTRPPPPPPPPPVVTDIAAFNSYRARLEAEPGIVVVEVVEDAEGEGYSVVGLRDPIARDPAVLLAESELEPSRVRARWEPYVALHPDFIQTRATRALAPPEGVTLRYEGGRLALAGKATREWIERARQIGVALAGVEELDLSGLTDTTARAWDESIGWIEAVELEFETDIAKLSPKGLARLGEAKPRIVALDQLARALDRSLVLEIIGNADDSGTPERNEELRTERAQFVMKELSGLAYTSVMLSPRPATDDDGAAKTRTVRFRVLLAEVP